MSKKSSTWDTIQSPQDTSNPQQFVAAVADFSLTYPVLGEDCGSDLFVVFRQSRQRSESPCADEQSLVIILHCHDQQQTCVRIGRS
eukprot:3357681-Rhodomonas_salina.1